MSNSKQERAAKVLLAKTSLDGHWRGISVVARALRDAGFELVMIGMARGEEIVSTAIDEDVDLVGLNVGGRIEIVERVLDQLEEAEVDVPVFAGGTIAPQYQKRLRARGVEIFPPGSSLTAIVEAARRATAQSTVSSQQSPVSSHQSAVVSDQSPVISDHS